MVSDLLRALYTGGGITLASASIYGAVLYWCSRDKLRQTYEEEFGTYPTGIRTKEIKRQLRQRGIGPKQWRLHCEDVCISSALIKDALEREEKQDGNTGYKDKQ